MLRFRLHTSDIELAELLYISIKTRPGITMANKFQCFILTKVASKNMIVIILENICTEIISRWYIDSAINMKKIVRIHKLSAICRDVFCSGRVARKSQTNVLVQCIKINNYNCAKKRKKKDCSLYRDYKLFLSEDRFEVVRVDCGIASIPLFWIDVPLSSKSIQFDTKISRAEPDNKIEL